MIQFVGPTGSLIKGNVLDCNLKHFQSALQGYDPDLYVKWNPRKLQGWGCWEIRHKPRESQVVALEEFNGATYVVIDKQESNVIHHVLDCGYLNYDALRKIK